MDNALIRGMDLRNIDTFLNQIMGGNTVSADDLITEIMQGNIDTIKALLIQYVRDVCVGNLTQCREIFLGIFLLGIFALLLHGVSDLFANEKITIFSHYFIFLFVSLILMKCFLRSYEQCLSFLDEMKSFCGVLMPAMCMVMGISGGPVTAAAYYELQLLFLFIVENIMAAFVMPMVQFICVLYVLNQLPEGNRFGGMIALMRKLVIFMTRSAIFAAVSGSLLQAGIMPAVDGVQSRVILKTVSFIPGLGDYAMAITETVLRGAVLVKNSIGIVGIFILFVMCFRPAVTTLMLGFVVRLASAVLQISGEKKFTSHVWKMADCFFLLSRVQLFASGMFFIAIAVATLGMNALY